MIFHEKRLVQKSKEGYGPFPTLQLRVQLEVEKRVEIEPFELVLTATTATTFANFSFSFTLMETLLGHTKTKELIWICRKIGMVKLA